MKKISLISILMSLLFPLVALAASPVNTYHNATGADNLNAAASLERQGFRPTYIGVHGTKEDPRYSAVWLQRAGPAWTGFYGKNLSLFPSMQAQMRRRSLYPSLLSVVSDGTNSAVEPVMAGTFEAGVETTAKIDLTSGLSTDIKTIQFWIADARKYSRMPTQISLYGTERNPKYAVIFKPNPTKVKWTVALWDTASDNQKRFSPTVAQWARPIFYSRSSFNRYVSIYVDSVVGPWEAFGPVDWQTYQNMATDRVSKGFFPLMVQGGGSGAQTTWSGVFVKDDAIQLRQFTAQGSGSVALKVIDDLMKKYMTDFGVRGASVAVVRNGKLVYGKGLTYAEPGYPLTMATSLFRLASTSKAITSIAIHQLEQRWRLTPNMFVQNILSIKTPDGKVPPDGKLENIKIDELLLHRGGWDRGKVYDLPSDVETAKSFNRDLPISKAMWISEKFKQDLQFDPGSEMQYSNFGYLLLGRVLENKYLGKSYEQIIKENVFAPLGIQRPSISGTMLGEARPEQVRFHENSLAIGTSVVTKGQEWVPLAYGAENYRNFDSFGGWMMAAPDYAKILASFELGDKNPILNQAMTTRMWTDPNGNGWARGWFRRNLGGGVWTVEHGGAMPGVGTAMSRRSDGISFVIFTNSGLEGNIVNDMHKTLAAIPAASWPTVDYFPAMGLPVNP